MPFIEKLKLWRRAWLYRYKEDIGEINYLISKIKKGDTVFDIGAHKAAYTYWMRKATGNNGTVICFEPQEKGFAYLIFLKQLMSWRNVEIENKALSDVTGEKTLYIQHQPFTVSFEASLENKYSENFSEQKISTTTVDEYCLEKNLGPSFVKIDVEGHEWEVLQGAKKIMEKYHPFILLECEARHIGKDKVNSCLQFLLSIGYKGYFIHGKLKRPLSDFNFDLHQSATGEKFWRSPDYCNNFIFEK